MSDWNGEGWGTDWNRNGEYDSYDRYVDYEMIHGEENSGSVGRGGSSSATTYLIIAIITIILGCFNELLAAIVLFGFFYYETFLK